VALFRPKLKADCLTRGGGAIAGREGCGGGAGSIAWYVGWAGALRFGNAGGRATIDRVWTGGGGVLSSTRTWSTLGEDLV
jgi:hypothetical protein